MNGPIKGPADREMNGPLVSWSLSSEQRRDYLARALLLIGDIPAIMTR